MGSRSLALLGMVLWGAVNARGEDDRLFRERVAPLLERRCISCHGEAAPKGKLSLTSAASLEKGGASGPAVVPGKPDESPLVEAISGTTPEMPKTGGPLSAAEVAGVRRWVELGAHWPAGVMLRDRRFEGQVWWAFRPLRRPPVPAVATKGRGWCRSPIDAFILAGLEAKGLAPAPVADRPTLIRRLTFDLHGLPPTPEEVAAFVSDPGADAYERLVDRLLASPRYGERWGRHWLDVVHYGDTHGYDKDKRRDHAWPYRDYVIRAFNEDLPYGRFAAEQVAGDVLRPGDPRGRIATGFVAAGPWDFVGHVELREGTVDKLKARLNDRDDMLANAMSTFQSLTVHCARCHDHKFDPIPQSDYYRLQAVFAGVERGDRPYDSPEKARRLADLSRRKGEASARHASLVAAAAAATTPDLARLDREIEAAGRERDALPPLPAAGPSPSNGYHSGIEAAADVEKWVEVDLGGMFPIEEIRLVPARPIDFPDTPGFGFPARFRVEIAGARASGRAVAVADHSAMDLANPGDAPYLIRPSGSPMARRIRVTATRLWKRTNDYVFALGEMEVISGGVNVAPRGRVDALDSIEGGRWAKAYLIDGFDSRTRIAAGDDPARGTAVRRRRDLQYRLQDLRSRRSAVAEAMVPPATRAAIALEAAAVSGLDREIRALSASEQVYAVVPRPPRPIHLLRRGDVEQPGPEVGPGALSCVHGLDPDFREAASEDEGARRVALARWITDRRNVLTWRSIVNRAWHDHFGRGLVETPNDFGRNGALPSHPELLDWLAVEFLEGGESLKALHRAIVTTATYRQSSRHDPAHAAKDADNRGLWRMNRRRLDAESVRDAVLAVSGRLDPAMGGPGVPLFRFKDDHSPVYDYDAPEAVDAPGASRRAVYRFVVRSVPDPFLEPLDCADPNLNTPDRATTITPLQALALLNDRFMVRQSLAFAHRLERDGGDLSRHIDRAALLALGRPPDPDERASLLGLARRRGLAAACRVLFNTNEFLFID